MSQAEIPASKIRDRAVRVVLAHGTPAKGADRLHLKSPGGEQYLAAPDLHTFSDQRLRISYCVGKPHAIDIYKIVDREQRVFGLIWNPDHLDSIVVLHHAGSWEQYLQRLAKGCNPLYDRRFTGVRVNSP